MIGGETTSGAPGRTRRTAALNATTKPACSCPGMNGSSTRIRSVNWLSMIGRFVRHAPAPSIVTTPSPGCADGWIRHVLPDRARSCFERLVISVRARSAHQLYHILTQHSCSGALMILARSLVTVERCLSRSLPPYARSGAVQGGLHCLSVSRGLSSSARRVGLGERGGASCRESEHRAGGVAPRSWQRSGRHPGVRRCWTS